MLKVSLMHRVAHLLVDTATCSDPVQRTSFSFTTSPHSSFVPSPIHRPPAVHLASPILPHPHLHALKPCITYLFPSRLSIIFIKLIIFASEIENGTAKADVPRETCFG